ncbi:hypothetical protein LINPERPRIM_LOCUS20021 [Linum perenne]
MECVFAILTCCSHIWWQDGRVQQTMVESYQRRHPILIINF